MVATAGRAVDVLWAGVSVRLGVDQLVEPADLALGGLLAVALQVGGVGVDPLAAAGRGLADRVEPLLEPRAAALEDAQAHVALGAGEEGEADVEARRPPTRRARWADQCPAKCSLPSAVSS